ncbi:hypothetical protein MMC08_002237 [Hypocenomyce scalaris]|nr:hypothetical protein [Hypocenomyce scalaris]
MPRDPYHTGRRPSLSLGDLFPEYDEPIEPGSRTPSPVLMDGKKWNRIGKRKQRTSEDWSDGEMPEIDYGWDTHDDSKRGGHSRWHSVGDAWRSIEPLPFTPDSPTSLTHRPPPILPPSNVSVIKTAATPNAHPKHHCILTGHVFRHERNPLRVDRRAR